MGHVLGGWTIAPVFTAGSGLPITLGTINGGGQAFGEGDSSNFFGYGVSENAIPITPNMCSGNASAHYNVAGSNGVGTSGYGLNMFSNPEAAYNNIRQPILGYDTRDGGFGVCRGMPYWNVDLSVKKQFNITERSMPSSRSYSPTYSTTISWAIRAAIISTPATRLAGARCSGTVTTNSPRQIQFGLRVSSKTSSSSSAGSLAPGLFCASEEAKQPARQSDSRC